MFRRSDPFTQCVGLYQQLLAQVLHSNLGRNIRASHWFVKQGAFEKNNDHFNYRRNQRRRRNMDKWKPNYEEHWGDKVEAVLQPHTMKLRVSVCSTQLTWDALASSTAPNSTSQPGFSYSQLSPEENARISGQTLEIEDEDLGNSLSDRSSGIDSDSEDSEIDNLVRSNKR